MFTADVIMTEKCMHLWFDESNMYTAVVIMTVTCSVIIVTVACMLLITVTCMLLW